MGRSLKNNLYNLGLVEVFEQALKRHEVKLENLYECEPGKYCWRRRRSFPSV